MATYVWYVFENPSNLMPPGTPALAIDTVSTSLPYPKEAEFRANLTHSGRNIYVSLKEMIGEETDESALEFVLGRFPCVNGVPSEWRKDYEGRYCEPYDSDAGVLWG